MEFAPKKLAARRIKITAPNGKPSAIHKLAEIFRPAPA